MRHNEAPRTIYLKDYRPPAFVILHTDLHIDLQEGYTLVTATLQMCRAEHAAKDEPLRLNGVGLELLELRIDDELKLPDSYLYAGEELEIPQVPDTFTLTSKSRIYPEKNTALEGLYLSNGMYCTQCEAEGFRKITWYLDRPDVMAVFRTTICADKSRYPVLLANGNPVDRGDLPDGRHFVTWEDPFKKPSYLFAMVAGQLQSLDDEFVTRSGRRVALQIFVKPKDIDKCHHAMDALKNSMRWDEEVYGREYDLDIFMIVAVSHFNMGAMENKGLNIFNTSCVLAHPSTTTDAGFQRVESVVAHEYFHNWSGNRVTCRDWFQLSLKEGFTVFRDQQFSADMQSASVQRIEDVSFLRAHQFAEDAGPLSHPVRPESFIEINNFYTATVYEKGSELVRMLHTLLGPDVFRAGSDLYFDRHDGHAATVEDFVAAMAETSQRDLSQFMRWYAQPGTPVLQVDEHWDAAAGRYTLTIAQQLPFKRGFGTPEALVIPLRMALLDPSGSELPLDAQGATEKVIVLDQLSSRLEFSGLTERPVPSLLRDFSAPVKLDFACDNAQLLFLMRHDRNGFNRWSSAQELFTRLLLDLASRYEQGLAMQVPQPPVQALLALVEQLANTDPALAAKLLILPSEAYLAEQVETVDPEALHQSREALRHALAVDGKALFRQLYDRMQPLTVEYAYAAAPVAARTLKNVCADYLMMNAAPEDTGRVVAQFQDARHMTDELAALTLLVHHHSAQAGAALARFYDRWRHEPLVLDQWFALQATTPGPQALATVKELLGHADFTLGMPNRVRALIGQFANNNAAQFHRADGAGYELLREQIQALDVLNPQIAARLLGVFNSWPRLEPTRRALVKEQLLALKRGQASPDVFENVERLLKAG